MWRQSGRTDVHKLNFAKPSPVYPTLKWTILSVFYFPKKWQGVLRGREKSVNWFYDKDGKEEKV